MTRYTRYRLAEFRAANAADQDSGVLSWTWLAALAVCALPVICVALGRGAA